MGSVQQVSALPSHHHPGCDRIQSLPIIISRSPLSNYTYNTLGTEVLYNSTVHIHHPHSSPRAFLQQKLPN